MVPRLKLRMADDPDVMLVRLVMAGGPTRWLWFEPHALTVEQEMNSDMIEPEAGFIAIAGDPIRRVKASIEPRTGDLLAFPSHFDGSLTPLTPLRGRAPTVAIPNAKPEECGSPPSRRSADAAATDASRDWPVWY